MSIPTALVSKVIYSLLAREAHLRMASLTKATDGTSQMLKPRNWEGEVFMPLVTVMLSLATHVIYIMSRKTDGISLVGVLLHVVSTSIHHCFAGNYDVSKMHYDGPGDVPGAPGGGYGYDVRIEEQTSAAPVTTALA
jgi:hypothetical protein